MQFWQFVFWISCGIVFYNYAGYAVLAWLFTRVAGKYKTLPAPVGYLPSISFIVAARL